MAEKPAFRAAMKRRRCLIPADGFYEWQAVGARKQPFFVRAKSGGPLAFAGLWETWTGPNGEELETAAIVTTKANRTLAPIHDRMPVVVPPEAFDLWLDCANVDPTTASALIAPAPENLLEAYPVSTEVNRVANDNPKLVERIDAGAEPVATPAPKPAKPKPAAKRAPAKRLKKDGGQGGVVLRRLKELFRDSISRSDRASSSGRASVRAPPGLCNSAGCRASSRRRRVRPKSSRRISSRPRTPRH